MFIKPFHKKKGQVDQKKNCSIYYQIKSYCIVIFETFQFMIFLLRRAKYFFCERSDENLIFLGKGSMFIKINCKIVK